jgi:bifunctional enzyme CysN/CysC/sulfate adenylyltransferase subunit 1
MTSRIKAIDVFDKEVSEAYPPMSVTVRLEDDLDVSRGDLLADPERPATVARTIEATVCWMSERPLEPRARLVLKHTTRTVRAIADDLLSIVDIATLTDLEQPERLELNDIGKVELRLAEPIAADPYAKNRTTGAFILIDEATNETVAAGMVLGAHA